MAEQPYSQLPDNATVQRKSGEDSLCVMLIPDVEDADTLDIGGDSIDIFIPIHELVQRTQQCYPMDTFDYDRLYLTGKMLRLLSGDDQSTVVIGGSSYAMVGLKESHMPGAAINMAVNAQDPYYTFITMYAATANKCIDTAIIVGGYYFWHTDMSDIPSDYYRSVLGRVNYPLFQRLHHFQGEPLQPIQQAYSDPFLERLFDLHKIRERIDGDLAAKLAHLDYYNDAYNPRPAHGMLQFPFREQPEATNARASGLRARGHNSNYHPGHLTDNTQEFETFLKQMGQKGVRVIIVIPPVTAHYRKSSDPTLKDSVYNALMPLQKRYPFTFLDQFEDPAFSDEDFQDYDHLNDHGAKKLADIVTKWIS